jgi:hypothetical protein
MVLRYLFLLALIPLGFLIYTVVSLKRLDITATHPRVIVEALIFVVILAVGIMLFLILRIFIS